MENKYPRLIAGVLLIIIVLILAVLYRTRTSEVAVTSAASTSTVTAVISKTAPKVFGKIATAGNLILEVPKKMNVKTEGNVIHVNHSVPLKHPNLCDFKGGAPQLSVLTDFNASFELIRGDLADAVRHAQGEAFVKQSMQGRNFKNAPGMIDPYSVNDLNGYRVTVGVEWCGRYYYYFPIGTDRYLIAHRDFVPELTVGAKKYSRIPNVIPLLQGDAFFDQIIASAQIK